MIDRMLDWVVECRVCNYALAAFVMTFGVLLLIFGFLLAAETAHALWSDHLSGWLIVNGPDWLRHWIVGPVG